MTENQLSLPHETKQKVDENVTEIENLLDYDARSPNLNLTFCDLEL